MKTLRTSALLCALLLTSAACGSRLPPDTSLEAKFAVRGSQVVAGLRATLPGIKALVCTPAQAAGPIPTCLKASDAIKVVGAIETAGGAAERLAQALAAVDTAKTESERQAGLSMAREFILSIQKTLSLAQVAPENEAARTSIVNLLQTVTTLLFAVLSF